MKKLNVIFICLGNICRSPTAEAVMKALIQRDNLEDRIFCDSAGTAGHHEGEDADARSITHSKRRGYEITSKSRPFLAHKDFSDFDYIVAMDEANYSDLLKLDRDRKHARKVFRLVQFCTRNKYKEVPDPFYGGLKPSRK
ncbi:MAG: low molecular weight phosphotyrosine protein phosphatase [Bdellovibrionales bacterium]|nr:low molecular weight phosphotyrosine protein phosphatase [Bdellovibrionales bacterium]